MTSSYTARYGGADADLAPRPLGTQAEATYVICSTPRSGSNLLGDALRSSGGLGVPMEYLDQQAAMPMLMRRWGADDLGSYIAHLHANRTDVTGWLGLKVHWHQLESFLQLLDGQPWEPRRAPVLREVVEQLFPGTRWIHLRREDDVAAAVSFHRAAATGRFVDLGDGNAVDDPDLTADAVGQMVVLVDRFAAWRASWARFFEVAGIEPFSLSYSELTDDLVGSVDATRTWLGVGPGAAPSPGTRRQASAWSVEAQRLVREAIDRRDGHAGGAG